MMASTPPLPAEPQPAPPLERFTDDFICVSEFSEQEGPVPLFVIPEHGSGMFDLNTFVLRIMAVDQNQAKTSDESGCFVEDTQVVLCEPKENACAYVHHFTLLDIAARGYVRPICMSYISRDHRKVMAHLESFLREFSKISALLKKGNHLLFKRDLEYRMADLKLTREALLQQQWNPQTEDGNQPQETDQSGAATPSSISELLEDLQQMHHKVRATLHEKLQYIGNEETDRSRGAANPNEDSSWTDHVDLAYKPKVIAHLFGRRNFDKKLRTLPELCEGTYSKAFARLRKVHQFFSRPVVLLALETSDALQTVPASSLLTLGRTVVTNFNLDVSQYVRQLLPAGLDSSLVARLAAPSAGPAPPSPSSSARRIPAGSPTSSSGSSYDSPYSFSEASTSPGTLEDSASSLPGEWEWSSQPQGAPASAAAPSSTAGGPPHLLICPPSPPPGTQGYDESDGGESEHLAPLKLRSRRTRPFTVESFAAVLWGASKTSAGVGLFSLRERYGSLLVPLVYSLLKGRPVVVLASPAYEALVRGFVGAVSLFVPYHWQRATVVAAWRTKPLRLSDLAHLRLVGLSRQHASLPKAVERYVSIFDIEAETLRAPAYKGELVEALLGMKKPWPGEEAYLAFLHTQLFDLGMKACLYYHACCIHPLLADNPPHATAAAAVAGAAQASLRNFHRARRQRQHSSQKYEKAFSSLFHTERSLSDSHINLNALLSPTPSIMKEETRARFFKQWNIQASDIDIVEYLTEVVKEQQALEVYGVEHMSPVIRLDYSPCVVFTNSFKRKK